MLPDRNRLRSTRDFRRVLKSGRKKGSRTVVVYLYDATALPVITGGPRVGLVVSKAVGNAVVRHAVSRKLRGVAARVLSAPPAAVPNEVFQPRSGALIAIRALPKAADADSEELEKDVRSCLRRIYS